MGKFGVYIYTVRLFGVNRSIRLTGQHDRSPIDCSTLLRCFFKILVSRPQKKERRSQRPKRANSEEERKQ